MTESHKPLHRISGPDLLLAEEVLKAAAVFMTPEKTMAQLFADSAEHVESLRRRGCSWKQIQSIFHTLNIDIEVSTLRSYLSRHKGQKPRKNVIPARRL